ncbi:MAG: hypothetical protein BA866_00275 [Desulfobulbaceae bacterium S5133MH15]|nr:MAG: hypothetical protein BA866_00275 [Desulfobulbaceae bacterium S5133MH15]OEU78175.1 MAG: hypothetical protein BA873_00260 [Desulfobulbaceae bacterium C00003063]
MGVLVVYLNLIKRFGNIDSQWLEKAFIYNNVLIINFNSPPFYYRLHAYNGDQQKEICQNQIY